MRTLILSLVTLASLAAFSSAAQDKFIYTEASDLTLVGKLMPTPNPYHRVDTLKYKGFTESENEQVRNSSGLAVAFRTNSKKIVIKATYGSVGYLSNTVNYATTGYDLYIKEDGKWLWASAAIPQYGNENKEFTLIEQMDGTMKECLMYLPLFSEETSIQIGVEEGSQIEAIDAPFRHRIGLFGSSICHGASASRSGMTWLAQFTRHTGIQLLSLGCSGNAKLQPYFADVLVDADVDAFIIDGFSNTRPELIKERLFPFLEKVRNAHPGVPIIFIQTLYRENRNFKTNIKSFEEEKIAVSDSLMAIAVKKYDDVYFLHPTATDENHDTTVDGIHPSDLGYKIFASSLEKKVCRILRKYGIK